MNNNLIKKITTPNLNDINYADSLNEAFNNINANFSILANHDFIKGDTGKSVKIKTDKVISYLDKIKECIEEGHNNDTLKTINVTVDNTNEKISLGLYDNITDNSTIHMIYSLDIDNDGYSEIETPLSSLYYVFLDGRYSNKWLGKFTPESYNNYIDIEDLSCIIVYENGAFKKLNNAFPTIYYEIGVGLCWKLNGNQTGIPVQGPAGKNGLNANLYIVKGNKANENKVNVTEIFENTNYISIDEFIKENNELNQNENYSAIILTDNETNFYFGSIQLQQNTITAFLSSKLPINTNINLNEINNALKGINITKNSTNLQGLFIPIETLDNVQNNEQKTHLMSSTSITNNTGESILKTDLILTPVNNINKLVIDNNNQINVNKYLYFKIDEQEIEKLLKESWIENNYTPLNKELDVFKKETDIENIINTFKAVLSSRNYVLKYKLQNVFKLEDGSIPNKYNAYFNFTDTSKYTAGPNNSYISDLSSMCLLNNDVIKLINKNNNDNNNLINTCFNCEVTELSKGDIPHRYKENEKVDINELPENSPKFLPLTGDNIYITPTRTISYNNLLKVIPNTFTQSIKNKNEFYRWCLDLGYDEFDPIELKQCSSDDKNYDKEVVINSSSVNVKDILILFNSIFTSNVFPTSETEILWFNGFSKDLRKNYTQTFEGIWNNNNTSDLDPIGVTVKKPLYDNGAVQTAFQFTNSENDNFYAIAISGWNYDNKKLFKFLQFKPAFNNDYKIKEDTAFNINYNVNITGDKNNPNKNLYVNGSVISDDVLSNTLEAKEIKNIYTNDDIVIGGDNSKLIIKPKNIDNTNNESDDKDKIIYTTLNNTNILTNNLNTNNILSKSLKINDVNNDNDKEFISTIEYNNGTSKDLNISLQGENSINIDFNLNPNINLESSTDNISNLTPNPLHISINKNDQSTNDLVLKTNFNKIDITNNTTNFKNGFDLSNDHDSFIDYVKSFKLSSASDILPNSALTTKTISYRVVGDSIVNASNTTDNDKDELKYRHYYSEGTPYLGITGLASVLSEYNIPIISEDDSSHENYNILSGLKYENNTLEKDKINVNNLNNKFKLKINKIFTFIAGVNSLRSSHIWPYLNNGNVIIKLKYTLINDNKEIVLFDADEFVTSKLFDIIGNDWVGKDIWGNSISSTFARDRLHQFHFKIDTLTTSKYELILDRIVEKLTGIQDFDQLQKYKLNVKVISYITVNWRHAAGDKIYGAFLTLPIVVKKFNDSSFNFTGGNNIMNSSNFNSVVWENYNTVSASIADNSTENLGWSMKFNTDLEYYLTPIKAESKVTSHEPTLNLCNAGLYISNNYKKNQEIVGLGFDSNGNTTLVRKYVEGKDTDSEITIAELINFITAAASNTDAQVGL